MQRDTEGLARSMKSEREGGAGKDRPGNPNDRGADDHNTLNHGRLRRTDPERAQGGERTPNQSGQQESSA
jgi:hypothetical protein